MYTIMERPSACMGVVQEDLSAIPFASLYAESHSLAICCARVDTELVGSQRSWNVCCCGSVKTVATATAAQRVRATMKSKSPACSKGNAAEILASSESLLLKTVQGSRVLGFPASRRRRRTSTILRPAAMLPAAMEINAALIEPPPAHVLRHAQILGRDVATKIHDALVILSKEPHGYTNMFKLQACWASVLRQHFTAAGVSDVDFRTYQLIVFGPDGAFPEPPARTPWPSALA